MGVCLLQVTAPFPGPAFQRDQPVVRGEEKRSKHLHESVVML